MRKTLTPFDYENLCESINDKKCILVLGPDLPVPGPDGSDRNLMVDLTEEIKEQVPKQEREGNETFPQIAQLFGYERRTVLKNFVQKFFRREENNPVQGNPSLFHQLAEIPFHLYVTSRYDFFMERALMDAGRLPYTEDYNFQGGEQEHPMMGTPERPLLYYLYGRPRDYETGEPTGDTMVMMEDDLLKFLRAVVAEEPALPDKLTAEFRAHDATFIFLGFGLRQWYVRIILHALQIQDSNSPSYAIEWLPPKRRKDDNIVNYYKRSFKIDLLSGDGQDFVTNLRTAWEDGVKRGDWRPLSTASLPGDQRAGKIRPKVFISYVKEDRNFVKYFVAELQKYGLDPWWDRQQLKSGDEWDPKLHSQIENCDFFVLLQTSALRERVEKKNTYVPKEVNTALAHHEEHPEKINFIHPVARGEFTMPGLGKFQTVKVENEQEIEAFATYINDLQKQRSSQPHATHE